MSRTAVVFSPKYYTHNPGKKHPESAKRLRVVINELNRGQLSTSNNWQYVKPHKATLENVMLIHDWDYVKHIERFCRSGGGVLDTGDTVVSRESFDVAMYAAGGALKAVDLVMKGQFQNAFALVRPPGHHAGRADARGFCVFNNVAIAVKHLLKKHGLRRVAVIDIDAHHGNGTQNIFYETDEVLYVSLHEDPHEFPKSGFIDQTGRRKGLGYTVNIPLPFETNDDVYLKALNEIAVPIVRQYKPQFILVSAGFDGHYADPVGRLSLSAQCYTQVYDDTLTLVSLTCNGRLVSVLEGGYSRSFVGKLAASAIAKMSGSPYVLYDSVMPSRKSVETRGQKILEKVKKVQKSFWNVG